VWPAGRAEDDAIASARFHRLLRRGREYGTRIDRLAALDIAAPDPRAGLHFICLNANIARQFEFVQGAWIASANFGALSGEQDPLLGNRAPFPTPPVVAESHRTDGFSRPGAERRCRRSTGLPRFVTLRGGAYFFLPGLAALRWIASD
jgi:deferrochelatase/peroxidase EfeB